MILIYPTYFPCLAAMTAIAQAEHVVFEVCDNYQKQTYRNRTYIAHSNGKLLLNVPIQHAKNGQRLSTREVIVDNRFPWQSQHWKSLQSAYRTSPFFEFYEDDLIDLFQEPVVHLLDFNLKIFERISELIGLETSFTSTEEYFRKPIQQDLRYLADVKKAREYALSPYNQVLQKQEEFIPNLSILDLLFNEGPNTLSYLENQSLDF